MTTQVGQSTLLRSHGSTLSITRKVGQIRSVDMSCILFSVLYLSEQEALCRCLHSEGHMIYGSVCHLVLNNKEADYTVLLSHREFVQICSYICGTMPALQLWQGTQRINTICHLGIAEI